MGLRTIYTSSALGLLASLLVLVSMPSCIDAIELPESEVAVLFIDGEVALGELTQTLRIGRTVGLSRRFDGITNVAVEVVDLTENRRFVYREGATGEYSTTFRGQSGHAYQLELTFPNGNRYTSRPDSLAVASFSLSGDGVLSQRADRDGELKDRNFATSEIQLTNVEDGAEGLILFRSFVSWRYADLVCGPFDGALSCYYEERDMVSPFALVELERLNPSDTTVLRVGSTALDFRFAEAAYFLVEAELRSQASLPYFRALNGILNRSGGLFAERPQTVVGNLSSETPSPIDIYGFFGVVDRKEVAVPALTFDIKGRAGRPLCRIENRPEGYDCCNCLSSTAPNQLSGKPSYWP